MGKYANEGRMKYSDTHEWVFAKGDVATVGITEHAQKELGEVVFVQLPEVGQKVNANQEVVVLESTKAAVDIYTPITGTVMEINEKLKEDPTMLNTTPEEGGWLFKIALSNKEELDTLLDDQQYLELITRESTGGK
jgi:glycine cleavage system H protein